MAGKGGLDMKKNYADIRILSDGMMSSYQNQFLNIFTDIPSRERKELDNMELPFSSHQTHFTSGELFNRKLREKYQVISYSLDELCYHYSTKDFLYLKFYEIKSTSEYFLNVLDMLSSINTVFLRIEKEKEQYNSRHKKTRELKPEQKFYASLPQIQKYLSLISDIKVTISNLTCFSENINLMRGYDELIYQLQINLGLTYLPKELLIVIDQILPGFSVNRIDTDNLNDTKNLKPVQSFLDFERQLRNLIKVFREKLMSQFSYYVTPQEFLNNPINRTIFVIDFATYRKLNFPTGGLYKSEMYDLEKSACGSDVYIKLEDFYTELQEYFSEALKQCKEQLEILKTYESQSSIQIYIDIYEEATKNNTGCTITKVKKQIQEPRYHEALNNLLIHSRLYMYKPLEELDLDRIKDTKIQKQLPWNRDFGETPQFEINTLHYLYDIQQRCFADHKVPYTALMRLFHLFSYSKNPRNRGPRHIQEFQKLEEKNFPESYVKDFIPLLQI